MEHPNEQQRENQAKLLAQLPEEEREEHALLLRFGNASYSYHRQAEEQEPTEVDFEEWLEGLPKNVRDHMKIRGFESCKGVVSFTRYVMEKNDIGMEEWMKRHLSATDYKAYYELIEKRGNGEDAEV